MVIKLFEDDNYNRRRYLNYTTGFGGDEDGAVFLKTNGDEKILDGQSQYDGSEKNGEIKNLMSQDFYDKASCIRIRPKIEGTNNADLFEDLDLVEGVDIFDDMRDGLRR